MTRLTGQSPPLLLRQKAYAAWLQLQQGCRRLPLPVGLLLVGLLTLCIQGYRLSSTPDIFSDEGVYLLVGRNLARGLGLVIGHIVFLWHPPAYMLTLAAFLKLAGLTQADTLSAVLAARWLNIGFSALTAISLVLCGRALHSSRSGFLAAGLFLMDPYVQRINRRNMLETLAMLCVLWGLTLFFTRSPRLTLSQRLGSGLAFGLAVLTKEAMFLELGVLICYVLIWKRSQWLDLLCVLGITGTLYLLYPAWIFAMGQGQAYLVYKRFGISRINHILTNHQLSSSTVTLPPSTRGSLLDSLLSRLSQYGMSYLLIALAALFSFLLLWRYRKRPAAQFLLTWSLFNLGFGLMLGRISDQYFYYLMVSSTLLSGYFFAMLLETEYRSRRRSFQCLVALCALLFLYNCVVWTRTYAFGSDQAYMDIVRYIQAHLPTDTVIEASDDVAVYYLTPPYTIRLDRDPSVIVQQQARYFILSYKDVQGGYDAMTPELYTWVLHNSCPVMTGVDLSFGEIGLYKLIPAQSSLHAREMRIQRKDGLKNVNNSHSHCL